MSRARNAYEVLGIAPGAERQAVEAAYRRLIKQHHPDAGGDGETARAIIHAYRSLTGTEWRAPVIVEVPPSTPKRGRRRLVPLSAALVLAAGLWWVPWTALDPRSGASSSAAMSVTSPAIESEAPVVIPRAAPDGASVEAAVDEAERLGRQSPELVQRYSRLCAADLARLPGDGLLDHCLAFDMAAARTWLLDGTLASRHLAAAERVLGDRVLAEARVRDVRLAVERRLVAGDKSTR